MKILLLIFLSFALFANELSLEKAISLAIKNNPSLKAIKKDIEIKKISGIANSKYPNPELELETSDFLGTDNYSGFKNTGISLSISQEIVLANKNVKSINFYDSQAQTTILEFKKQKINLEYKIRNIFLEILSLKEQQKLLLENKKISEDILKTIENIKNSGEISQLELIKAQIEAKNSIIELKTNKRKIEALKNILFIIIGEENLNFTDIKGELETYNDDVKNYDIKKLKTIDLKIKESNYLSNLQALKLEKANSIPNLTLKLGVNRYQEFGDYSFTFAISMPLPIFNSNKEKIKGVKFELEKNKLEVKSVKLKLEESLNSYKQELKILLEELKNLKNDILPRSVESLNLAKEGYKEGEFKYLDLLDAKKTFIAIKKEYIEKLSKYNLLKLRINYLLQ